MFSGNNPLIIKKNNMIITYDIRVEAVYCLLVLSGYNIISPYSKDYQMKIFRTFNGIIGDDYVKHFSKICCDKFKYVIPCSFALTTEYDNGMLHKSGTMKEAYIKRLGGNKEVENCFESLSRFIYESDFLNFFYENQDEYIDYLHKNKKLFFSVMNDVQKLYGEEMMLYTIYVSQLIHPGGFSVGIDSPACILGSILYSDYTVNEPLSMSVCFHEFSHYFIDKFISANWQDIHQKVNYLSNGISSNNYLSILCQQEFFSEIIIRTISNYYCYIQSIPLNMQDFIDYPYSYILFKKMIKRKIVYINNDVLDMLLSETIVSINKEKRCKC